jgi:hypothetical protein
VNQTIIPINPKHRGTGHGDSILFPKMLNVLADGLGEWIVLAEE